MGAHFGLGGFAMKSPIDYDGLRTVSPTVFPTLQEAELGDIAFEMTSEGLKVYRFVQVDAASAAVANGTALVWKTVTSQKVTTVNTGLRNSPAGVGIGTITVGNRGWIQIGGYHSAVKTNGDDDIALDCNIIMAGADGVVDSSASGTLSYRPFGVAVDVDDNDRNTVPVLLSLFGT